MLTKVISSKEGRKKVKINIDRAISAIRKKINSCAGAHAPLVLDALAWSCPHAVDQKLFLSVMHGLLPKIIEITEDSAGEAFWFVCQAGLARPERLQQPQVLLDMLQKMVDLYPQKHRFLFNKIWIVLKFLPITSKDLYAMILEKHGSKMLDVVDRIQEMRDKGLVNKKNWNLLLDVRMEEIDDLDKLIDFYKKLQLLYPRWGWRVYPLFASTFSLIDSDLWAYPNELLEALAQPKNTL